MTNRMITELDRAIESHPFKPRGVKVGVELYRGLRSAGRITMQPGILPIGDIGFDYPVLNGCIFVIVDPDIVENVFVLPGSK